MKPYNETEEKKDQIREMFNHIAPKYDTLNRLLSFGIDTGWRRRLVRRLAKDKPLHILDMATGTGDLAVMISRKIPEARIVAADLSPGMLEIAKQKFARKKLPHMSTVIAEAENIPYADGEFDAVTVAFGVRNYHDIKAGLKEMGRVIRPGGVMYILEFQTPRSKIFGKLYRFYFHRVLPTIGGWISKDKKAYTYLPKSVDDFPATPRFTDMIREAGFASIKATALTNGVAYIYKGTKI